jgi:uncharacterized membrane protein affecting hemolysin expression
LKTSTKIGIAVLSVLVLIIIGGVVFEMRVYQVSAHRSYCDNWSSNLDERKADLNSSLLTLPSDKEQLNTQIDQYNKECAF